MSAEKEKEVTWSGLAGLLLGGMPSMAFVTVLFMPLTLACAWTEVRMWDWFVVPYLRLPHVGVWQMVAFSFFVGMWRRAGATSPKTGLAYLAELITHYQCLATFFLAAAAIHYWVLR